jgi:tRNA(fMet)-specific endonuclease VapC
MARLILDTSVIVHLHRLDRPIADLYEDDDDVVISAVTASELLMGVELVHERRRGSRERAVEALLEALPVEDFDLDAARAHARLLAHTRRTGRQRGAHDLLIAATAVSRDRTVLTRDPDGFADLPGVTFRSVR